MLLVMQLYRCISNLLGVTEKNVKSSRNIKVSLHADMPLGNAKYLNVVNLLIANMLQTTRTGTKRIP